MKHAPLKIILLVFGLLAICFMGGTSAGTMDIIEDSLKFTLGGGNTVLLPGSSPDTEDTISTVGFKIQFLTATAPEGTVTQVDFYFTFDTTRWYYLSADVDTNNWDGDIDLMDDPTDGEMHFKLTGNGCSPPTSLTQLAKVSFVPLCQMAGHISGPSYTPFATGEDNGASVVDSNGSHWYATSDYTNSFMMPSAYISNFYVDCFNEASALMGDSVTVPVYLIQHTMPHRLFTVDHQLEFDNTKLDFLGAVENDTIFQSGAADLDTYYNSDSGYVNISIGDSADGYLKMPASTSTYVKLYDLTFRVLGHTNGPGNSIDVNFVEDSCSHLPWTKWNEGGGDGCDALDTTAYDNYFDGDVAIPNYIAGMNFTPLSDYSKGDGSIEYLCSIKNNFPAGDYSTQNNNGGIGTLFALPDYLGLSALADSNGLDFSGQTYINGEKLFYAAQQPTGYIQSENDYTNMYKVRFSFADNDYTIDYDDRTVSIPWLSSGNNWETFIEDTTGYAVLDLDDITDSTFDFNVNMGRFYAPFAADNNTTIDQPLYISATFDIGEFSVNVNVSGNCTITGVTTEDDVDYTTVSNKEVQIYYDDTAKFCDASDDSLVQIATVHYRVSCAAGKVAEQTPPGQGREGDDGGGTGFYVTGTVSFDDESIEEYQGDEHFVDLVPHNVRGYCGVIWIPGITKDNELLPDDFSLYPNRPNPFNPQTVISYDVPAASHVTIRIVNILGQHVTTLVDEQKAPGQYEAVWNGVDANGSRVASGIYLYNMRAGDFTETKKMMLMK